MPTAPDPQSRPRRRRGPILVLIVAGLVGGAVLVLLALRREGAGAATPVRALERFVAAAAARDRAATARLARRGEDQADVDEAFRLVPAGTRLEHVAVEQPFGPDVAFGQVRGALTGAGPWQSRFTLNRRQGRWFVAVGTVPSTRSPSSTQRPR